jgi:hypothetical protein
MSETQVSFVNEAPGLEKVSKSDKSGIQIFFTQLPCRLEESKEDLLPPLPEALERHVKLVKDGDTLGVQASQPI